jgi:hypothetical protein
MGILLVLGSVTSKQYFRVRLAMAKAGMNPKVLRIKEPIPSIDDVLEQIDNEMKGKPFIGLEKHGLRFEEIKQELLVRLFGEKGLGGIDAIVQEEPDAQSSVLDFWGCIDEALDLDLPHFIVRKGDDGSYWLDGAGLEEHGLRTTRRSEI